MMGETYDGVMSDDLDAQPLNSNAAVAANKKARMCSYSPRSRKRDHPATSRFEQGTSTRLSSSAGGGIEVGGPAPACRQIRPTLTVSTRLGSGAVIRLPTRRLHAADRLTSGARNGRDISPKSVPGASPCRRWSVFR